MLFKIPIHTEYIRLTFDTAKEMTHILAEQSNPQTDLIAWKDAHTHRHSPSLPADVECTRGELEHWEKYGMHHDGRLRFIINEGEYEFIYT